MSQIAVIKCGGSIINRLTDRFFDNIKQMQNNGIKPIVIHGGGPEIQDMLEELNISFSFIDGLRITSMEAMDIVEMVLAGRINQKITRNMNNAGIKAVGLSGADADLITGVAKDWETYGYVGDVTNVNTSFLMHILEKDIVPVIAPIASGDEGFRYNVNSDHVAGSIAQELQAEKLIFMTDVPGIITESGMLLSTTDAEIEDLIAKRVIYGGMIPKVRAAVACLNEKLSIVIIADANQEISHAGFTGTTIKKSEGIE